MWETQLLIFIYRTRAIITRSWFETALDYKPWILVPTFLVYVLKWFVILTSLALKNGVKDIKAAGYNGACTVIKIDKTVIEEGILEAKTECYAKDKVKSPLFFDHFTTISSHFFEN